MTEKNGKEVQHWNESNGYEASHQDESYSVPETSAWYEESPAIPKKVPQYSSPVAQPNVQYGHSHGVMYQHKTVTKKVKKAYDPGYMPVKHHACPPIVCDPQYIMHDCYIQREVPVIQPIIHVYRHNIVNVPKHYVQPSAKNVIVDPGCPK